MKNFTIVVVVAVGLLFIVLFLLSAMLIIFQWPEFKPARMVGSYIGSYDVFPKITTRYRKGIFKGGLHSLELKSDGTYIYIYHPTDGNDVKTIGTWEFTNKYGPEVVLNRFLMSPSRISDEKPAIVYLPIYGTCFGSIRILIDGDSGYYWIKRKKPVKVEKKNG